MPAGSPAPSGARVDGTRDESCCRPLRATRSTRRDSWRASTCSASASTRWPRPSRPPRRRWRRRTARSRACAASSQLRDEQIQALAARPQAPAAGDPRELHQLKETVAALSAERASREAPSRSTSSPRRSGSSASGSRRSRRPCRRRPPDLQVATASSQRSGNDSRRTTARRSAQRRRPTSASSGSSTISRPRPRHEAALDGQAAELESLKSQLAERQRPPADELRAMLTMLRTRVEALDGLGRE